MPTIEHKVSFDKVFDGLTNHVKRYKVAYSLGAGIAVAGITCLIMRSNIARGAMGGANTRGEFANTASLIFRSPQTVNVTTVLDRGGRGHPGWPVQNLETKRVFFSQKQAAEAFGIPEQILSGHLNGKFPNVDDLHFQRVNLVPSA